VPLRLSPVVVFLVLAAAGCRDSGTSNAAPEGEHASNQATEVVRHFYVAADKSAGQEACALLTSRGIGAIVRVQSRAACVHTIDAFAPGSFSDETGSLLHIEGVEEGEDGFDVDATVKGRSAGAYSVVRRDGRLLIDGFKSEEG
jgi:hypothetical protein